MTNQTYNIRVSWERAVLALVNICYYLSGILLLKL